MKRLFLLSLTIIIFNLLINAQTTGGLIDLERISHVKEVSLDTLFKNQRAKSTQALPASYYLTTPPIGNQGSQGSCSGWAVGYAAVSILAYNKYWQDCNLAKMSPSFIYNQVKIPSTDCNTGAYLIDAVELVNTIGVCLKC